MDRNGPIESRAKRAEESKRESEVEGVGEEKARDADARQKKRLEMSWRVGEAAPRRRCCSVKPQCPRRRRCQHPSAASFPKMARSKTQRFVLNGGKKKKKQGAKSATVCVRRRRDKSGRAKRLWR